MDGWIDSPALACKGTSVLNLICTSSDPIRTEGSLAPHTPHCHPPESAWSDFFNFFAPRWVLDEFWGGFGGQVGAKLGPSWDQIGIKIDKKSIQKSIMFLISVKMDLSWILDGFWRYLGLQNQ